MVSWEFFQRKRKIDVQSWIARTGIKTYADFCQVLTSLGVSIPSEDVFMEYVPSAKSSSKTNVKSSAKPKKSRSRTRNLSSSKIIAPDSDVTGSSEGARGVVNDV